MPVGVAGSVLEQVRERPLELGGVGAHERQLVVDRELELAPAWRRGPPPRAGPRRPSTTPAAARRRAPRAARGRAAPRSGATAARPPARCPSASSRRSSSSSRSPASGSAAAMIAVSGVRRSWLTARSSAVLSTSLRRSARVSTTSVEQRVALQRRGEQRLERRHDPLLDAAQRRLRASPAAAAACRAGARPRAAGTRRARSSPSTGCELDRRRRELQRRREPLRRPTGSARRRSSPRSSVRAISAARSASRRRCSASIAALRARSASALATIAATRKTTSATQFSPSAIVKLAGRRDVEVVERQRARERRRDRQPHAPERRDEQHRQQVDDAQRDVRRHRLSG